MRVVIQRSGKSKVIVEEKVVGEIERGLVLLVCFEKGDTKETVSKASKKILALRIFPDEESGKMNKSILDVDGEILAISQFTLSWQGEKGNRPSFDQSMAPEQANEYFKELVSLFKTQCKKVETGQFGAFMEVSIQNMGPVTFSLSF